MLFTMGYPKKEMKWVKICVVTNLSYSYLRFKTRIQDLKYSKYSNCLQIKEELRQGSRFQKKKYEPSRFKKIEELRQGS